MLIAKSTAKTATETAETAEKETKDMYNIRLHGNSCHCRVLQEEQGATVVFSFMNWTRCGMPRSQVPWLPIGDAID